LPHLSNFNPNLPPPPLTISSSLKQNVQKTKKDLEAEYESFLLLTGQLSNRKYFKSNK
jgi:hypothetical protein